MANLRTGRYVLMLCGMVGLVGLSGCEDAKDFNLFKKKAKSETTDRAALANSSVKLVERDIEVPDVFQETDQGLWDGRPSLGGVWVAHPSVKDPERVIIRNESNGKFVIGALFRRERDNPGPIFQVSSDAAAALDMLAGAPVRLNITALRRAEVPLEGEPAATTALTQVEEVETASLDPIAAATAALDNAEAAEAVAAPAASIPAPTPKPAPASALKKPFIQIGLFSFQENAERAGNALRAAGVLPTVQKNTSSGKDYWRITVGPATNAAERATLLKKIKGLGYDDAYFVTN